LAKHDIAHLRDPECIAVGRRPGLLSLIDGTPLIRLEYVYYDPAAWLTPTNPEMRVQQRAKAVVKKLCAGELLEADAAITHLSHRDI